MNPIHVYITVFALVALSMLMTGYKLGRWHESYLRRFSGRKDGRWK